MTDIVWQNVTVTLGQLQPWERNPKSISKAHAKRLLASWDKFGQFQTVAIGPGFEVYDGHQRLSVLRAAFGDGYSVAARQSSRELSDSERRELVIAAHVGTTGQFNWDELANWDAAELQEWGLDGEQLKDWKAGIGALTELIEAAKEEPPEDPGAQIDKAEELREKWGVETGQLWKLGEHRLVCGDCTDRAVVERVMGGEKAALLFTSPPYLDARDYEGADLNVNKIIEFIPLFADYAELQAVNLGIIRKDNEVLRYWDEYIAMAELHGLKLLSWNIWDRSNPYSMAQQTAMFPIEHEWVFVFGAIRKQLNLTVENKRPGTATGISNRQKNGSLKRETPTEVRTHRPMGTIFRGSAHAGEDIGHPAMFPVALPEAYIEACTNPGDKIAEPFLGSGTTLIACERLGRKCRAIEISPAYVSVAIQRWVDMTGGTPELITAN